MQSSAVLARYSQQRRTFWQTLTDAVADFAENGYDSELRLKDWLKRLRGAAVRDMVPADVAEDAMRDALRRVYSRLVDDGGLVRANPGAGRFTLERVRPELRAELDRRILASAALIKLNRERAVHDTLQRFSGWATSVPVGGSDAVARNEVKDRIKKRLQSMGYVDRRLHIDQGHKFATNLSDIFAKAGGALAGIWHQHYTRYPRETHTARDGKVFLIRGSWAQDKGLVRPGLAGYADEVTAPGEEVFCRCSYEFVYGLSQLPAEMLTQKGRDELARVRAMIKDQKLAA